MQLWWRGRCQAGSDETTPPMNWVLSLSIDLSSYVEHLLNRSCATPRPGGVALAASDGDRVQVVQALHRRCAVDGGVADEHDTGPLKALDALVYPGRVEVVQFPAQSLERDSALLAKQARHDEMFGSGVYAATGVAVLGLLILATLRDIFASNTLVRHQDLPPGVTAGGQLPLSPRPTRLIGSRIV